METIENTRNSVLESYDYEYEAKKFNETKAGVKGIADSGVLKIPRLFILPPQDQPKAAAYDTRTVQLQVPVINLQGLESSQRAEIVKEIQKASETWGFFQMVNHGVPTKVMNQLLDCCRKFHGQPKEQKLEYYTRDYTRRVKYYCGGDLRFTKTGQWRDTLVCDFEDSIPNLEGLPLVCGEAMGEYVKYTSKLRDVLSELLSEALGLLPDHLAKIECLESQKLVCHYYPPCPQPDLTLGVNKHADPYPLTILLQDSVGGLQVLYQDQWVNVIPINGALVVNIGDFLQLISNDKFKSVEHRALARLVGPRISVACFFFPSARNMLKSYGPLEEFVSETNPPLYRKTNLQEYGAHYSSKGHDGTSALLHFKQ